MVVRAVSCRNIFLSALSTLQPTNYPEGSRSPVITDLYSRQCDKIQILMAFIYSELYCLPAWLVF